MRIPFILPPQCENLASFLHLTDMHLDLEYSVGSPTQCILGSTGLGGCHQYDIPNHDSNISGKWGDKNCDLPITLLNETLKWINDNLSNFDFVIYGGDTIGHHDLSQSPSKNLATLKITSQLFSNYFKDLPFIVNQGNHDTFPIDQTPPFTGNNMRKAIISNLTNLISIDQQLSFINHGFYLKKISPTLTIISINSIDYDSRNLFRKWTLKNSVQDIWLNKTLSDIRTRGEQVYLLGHIFPTAEEATDIYNKWLLEYLYNYRDVIKASFFGHSHNDQFKIYLPKRFDNLATNSITIPMLVTPSFMPDKRDPCFRQYFYHKTNNVLVDYRQYCVDLDKTNNENKLIVYLDYQFSHQYNLSNITGESYNHLLNRFKNSENAIIYCKKYIGNKPNWTNQSCTKE